MGCWSGGRVGRSPAGGASTYRAGELTGGAIAPPDPAGEDWVDVCIDEAGLVIAEERAVDGDVIRRRTATAVEEEPTIRGSPFAVEGDVVPVLAGGGAVQRVTDESRPPEADFWELEAAPGGFQHRGRFAVSPPAPGTEAGALQAPTRAGVADVWVRGPTVLVVENGGTVGGEVALGDHPHGSSVDLGDLGGGQVVVDLRASEVRVDLEGGRYVRVYGHPLARRPGRRRPPPPAAAGGTITTVDEPA